MKMRGRFDLREWCRRLREVAWLLAAAGVPLVFNPFGGNAFELPKTLFLRLLALVTGVGAVVAVLAPRDPSSSAKSRSRFICYAAMAFGLALIAATLFSVDRRGSLWGGYDRQQGLITRLSYLLLFVATARGLQTRKQVMRLWTALVWGSLPVVVYGLLQSTDVDPLGLQVATFYRITATTGDPDVLGHYLALAVPLTIGRMALTKRGWLLRSLYLLLVVAQVTCLLLSGPLSAYIGLAVALVLGLVARSVATKQRGIAWAGLGFVLGVVMFLALLGVRDGPLAELVRLPGLKRLASLIRVDTAATAAWFAVWRATLPLIWARPLLGYGPDAMRFVFAQVLPAQITYFEGQQVVIDRARNIWLDLAMSTGVTGLLPFVALLIAITLWARRGLRASSEPWQRMAWATLVATVSGHLVDLQLGFDLTTSAIVFWLVLAMGGALGENFGEVTDAPPAPDAGPSGSWASVKSSLPMGGLPMPTADPALGDGRTLSNGGAGGVALLASLPVLLAAGALTVLLCVRPLQADVAATKSRRTALSLPTREDEAERAVRLWPYEPTYYLDLANVLQAREDFSGAEDALLSASELTAADPRIWAELGELYVSWSAKDPGRFSQAVEAYQRAIALTPNVATWHTELGLALARTGHPEEAVLHLEQAVALDVSDRLAWERLAELYETLGQEEDAAWAAEEAERWAVEE
ncbi:MAG: tetratricopeptide repeat protein [Anaerolineae bacterium]